jgi:hypothetical protein
MTNLHHNPHSAAQIRRKPVLRLDADGDCIEPSEVYEVQQAAKRCLSILKRAKGWMSGAELRREAKLTEYCVRNFDAIKGLIGDHIEKNEYSSLPRYRYCPARVIERHEWNKSETINPGGRKAEWNELGVL